MNHRWFGAVPCKQHTPNHWTFKTKSGNALGVNEILIADAFIGVLVEADDAGEQLTLINPR